MNLVMCSGNSPRNRDWILEVDARVGSNFDQTYVQDYQHWQTGNEWIDLPHELPLLAKAAEGLGIYGVFAKSIGTVLTVQALEKQLIKPKFLLFCGIPLGYIVDEYPQFAEVLAAQQIPVAIIHNDEDKVGTSQAVLDYFGEAFKHHPDYRLIETHGNSHDYEDYTLIENELQRLAKV